MWKLRGFQIYRYTLILYQGTLLLTSKFIKAAKRGNLEQLKALVVIKPHLVYSFDFMNKTALHWAILRNKTECAKFLILKQSYINARDALNKHALYYAIQNKNPEIVYILLKMKVHLSLDLSVPKHL